MKSLKNYSTSPLTPAVKGKGKLCYSKTNEVLKNLCYLNSREKNEDSNARRHGPPCSSYHMIRFKSANLLPRSTNERAARYQ